MKRFRNIVLLYECDPATLERAAELAKSNDALLTVVQVVREMPGHWREVSLGGTPVDLQALAVKEYRARLDELVTPLKREGVRASTKVLVGTPFLEIIREVIGQERDLVMMTAEGGGGLTRRLFGSTSLHLMRKCPCPVWVMKPTRHKRFLRVLASVDPESAEESSESMNATILGLASSLAQQESADLHVVHAWRVPYEGLMRGRAGFDEADIRRHADEEATRRRRMLESLIATHVDGRAMIHLVEGEADEVIPEFAETQNTDLLVMGTVCRTGIPGFFIGNTAETILDEVDCSVLTVKPAGFVSPVTLS